MIIQSVQPDGPPPPPAWSGDILLALDGAAITGPDALLRRLASDAIGRPLPARLIRSGRLVDAELRPVERQTAQAA